MRRPIAAAFPGTGTEVHREILGPVFRQKTGADLTLHPMLATEQLAKLRADWSRINALRAAAMERSSPEIRL